jgi:hypothetical protein
MYFCRFRNSCFLRRTVAWARATVTTTPRPVPPGKSTIRSACVVTVDLFFPPLSRIMSCYAMALCWMFATHPISVHSECGNVQTPRIFLLASNFFSNRNPGFIILRESYYCYLQNSWRSRVLITKRHPQPSFRGPYLDNNTLEPCKPIYHSNRLIEPEGTPASDL